MKCSGKVRVTRVLVVTTVMSKRIKPFNGDLYKILSYDNQVMSYEVLERLSSVEAMVLSSEKNEKNKIWRYTKMTLEGEQYVESQRNLLIKKLQKRWSFDTDDLESLETLCQEFVFENAVGAVQVYNEYVNNLSESEDDPQEQTEPTVEPMEVDQKIKLKFKTETQSIKNMFAKKTVVWIECRVRKKMIKLKIECW